MSYEYWKSHVPAAERRVQAEKAVTMAKKAGQDMHPVRIEGRTIARTFWGKAWCDNLETYSDFENRLPRGRTYVRNGSVIDLKIEPGKVRARVMGSSLYTIEIGITAVPDAHWKSLAKECTGSIASLVELLQGKLSKAVMERICQPKTGLFPTSRDIQLRCSCPDWAMMCKHVAAVLYGVGARLDAQPELLFTLRQVDANDLVAQAAELPVQTRKTPARSKVLDDSQLADVFGIVMDTPEVLPDTKSKAGTRRTKPAEPPAPPAVAAKTSARTSAKKKAAGATTRPTTGPQPRTEQAQATEAPVSVSKSINSTPGKRASRKSAPSAPAQTKRKKTRASAN
jgi:uncharacterized Zn finger protein